MNEMVILLGIIVCCLLITFATYLDIDFTWQERKEYEKLNNKFAEKQTFVSFIHTSITVPIQSLLYKLPKEYRLNMKRRPPIICVAH